MRKPFLFLIAVLFLNAAWADPVPPRLMRNFKGFHVMKAGLQKGVLRLTTTHGTVSRDIYENMIVEGACSVLLANPEKGWEKARIDRIEVMSRDERQGYAFIEARKACFELDGMADEDKRRAFFSGQTWICARGICHDPRQTESRASERMQGK